MSHEALEKTTKGRATYPNVWFVGLVPRRNPELVVAVLWENGEFSYYPARIGAQVVAAFVNKKRREAHNLPPTKAAAPVEVGAVWSVPDSRPGSKGRTGTQRAFFCRWQWDCGGRRHAARGPSLNSETRRTTSQVAALATARQEEP